LVVEDEGLLRGLVAAELARSGFTVETAADGASALVIAETFDPDAIVMDVDLGRGPSGFDIAMVLAQRSPGLGVVFLTNLAAPEAAQVRASELPRGSAFLRKTTVGEPGMIAAALEAVLCDAPLPRAFRHDLATGNALRSLSRTQVEVLDLIAEGLSNQEIADRRASSLRAVERLINRTFTALGLAEHSAGNPRVLAVRAYLEARGRP
jgi:DNA-binding NarL/FixJ family response regulator